MLADRSNYKSFDSTNLGSTGYGEGWNYPGNYQITGLKIETPAGKEIGLGEIFLSMSIYESIYSNTLQGSLLLLDGVGILEAVPIIGEETLNVSLSVQGAKPKADSDYDVHEKNPVYVDMRFRVYRADFSRRDERSRYVTLNFVSEEYFQNVSTKVYMSSVRIAGDEFGSAGSYMRISDMVRKIWETKFSGSTKKFLIEPTAFVHPITVGNMTPFRAFNFLAERASSLSIKALGSAFLFYETLRGYRFVSLETLSAGGFSGYVASDASSNVPKLTEENPYAPIPDSEKIKGTYIYKNKRALNDKDGKHQHFGDLYAVEDFSFTQNNDVLRNYSSGLYASRLITHDLLRMRVDYHDYYYGAKSSSNKERSISSIVETILPASNSQKYPEKNITGFELGTHMDGTGLNTNDLDVMTKPESVTNYLITDGRGLDDDGTSKSYVDKFLTGFGLSTPFGTSPVPINSSSPDPRLHVLVRQSQLSQFGAIKVTFTVPGDSARNAGDLVAFDVPSMVLGQEDDPHRMLSGNYIISAINHTFSGTGYTQEMELVKDSYSGLIDPNNIASNILDKDGADETYKKLVDDEYVQTAIDNYKGSLP